MRRVVHSVYWLGDQKIGGSIFSRAATFLRHTQNKVCHPSGALPKWNPRLTFWEQSARNFQLVIHLYKPLTLRMYGDLPLPRRMLRRPKASKITLCLTWYEYLCSTFAQLSAQKTLENFTLRSEAAVSSKTLKDCPPEKMVPHSRTN
jgi:hypothetical protein